VRRLGRAEGFVAQLDGGKLLVGIIRRYEVGRWGCFAPAAPFRVTLALILCGLSMLSLLSVLMADTTLSM
jgi:hypothetical protein